MSKPPTTPNPSAKSKMPALLLTLLLGLVCAAKLWADIVVSDAWIRLAPVPGIPLAAYATVQNNGANAVVIESLLSDDFERAEWHTTVVKNDVAQMRQRERVEIAAGETVTLAPGGDHFMLFEPQAKLSAGDRVTLVLVDNKGNHTEFEAQLKRLTATDGDSEHHHHH